MTQIGKSLIRWMNGLIQPALIIFSLYGSLMINVLMSLEMMMEHLTLYLTLFRARKGTTGNNLNVKFVMTLLKLKR